MPLVISHNAFNVSAMRSLINRFITDDIAAGEHRGSGGGLISSSISIDNIHYRYLMYMKNPVRSSQTPH
ncbi:hypothetical protein AERO9A_320222 [Aeromonas salmonicida]|nr:hypothetical protein AERO9A_320222 [Aeromonas salmonicida]